ncbi:ankyrin repeat domain-containing protein [Williamsia sp.]|uniref:ankyrin repeat domain-containing protein n=1 Tax=Williamsia sp. TaxID=1872085 RepID=UPI002F92D173
MDQQSTSISASPPILSVPPTTVAPQPDLELETRDADGRTPLVVATKAGDVEAARTLILAGADVNAEDNMSDSAFLYAGAEGMDEILILTLAHGADVRSLNRFGGTALIPAAEKGHPTTVQLLIDAGVPLDHVNDSGWTALLEAVVYGDGSQSYQEVVGRLVAAGADPDIRDLQGRTALDNARIRGQSGVVRLLGG